MLLAMYAIYQRFLAAMAASATTPNKKKRNLGNFTQSRRGCDASLGSHPSLYHRAVTGLGWSLQHALCLQTLCTSGGMR